MTSPEDQGGHPHEPEPPELDREALRREIEHLEELEVTLRHGIEELEKELKASKETRTVRRDLAAKERSRRLILGGVAGLIVTIFAVGAVVTWARYIPEERFSGAVIGTEGAAPVRLGEPCTARVTPAFLPFNGWMMVECGGLRLYGHDSSGYVQCEAETGRVDRCEDGGPSAADGDPELRFERTRVRISDPGFAVTIALGATQ